MKFIVKKLCELTAEYFELYQIWGAYYEPEDIDSLVKLGYEFGDIHRELKKINYSDEYTFPIPINGANAPFKYIYYSINAKLACGKILKGYCSSSRAFAIGLFYKDKEYLFNLNLKSEALIQAEKLTRDISGESEGNIFPIEFEIPSLRKRGIFTFD